MVAKHESLSRWRDAVALATLTIGSSLTLSACMTPSTALDGQVRAMVTDVSTDSVKDSRLVSGEIENGTQDEVHTVVLRLGAYDDENRRTRSLYHMAGPLPGGARTRFTLSCQLPCTQVKVESIDAF
ncbi:FxLYD domain-containing protein [Paraburkholderia sp. RL17-373-BIF-A]|uniref:FxLYD domain-containing protein n=1 Tax=Paraburkholderia sp. RL17-373-BIF-A TaxID=3031629 RepID=UPI0038B9F79E